MNEANWWIFLVAFVAGCLFIRHRSMTFSGLPKSWRKDWQKPLFVPSENGDVEVDIKPPSAEYLALIKEMDEAWEEEKAELLIKGQTFIGEFKNNLYLYLSEAPGFECPSRTADSITFSREYDVKYCQKLFRDRKALRITEVRENLLKTLVSDLKDRGWNYIELNYYDDSEENSSIKFKIGQAKDPLFVFNYNTPLIEYNQITTMTPRGKITTKPTISWLKPAN